MQAHRPLPRVVRPDRRFQDGFPKLLVDDAEKVRNRHVAFLASFHDPGERGLHEGERAGEVWVLVCDEGW